VGKPETEIEETANQCGGLWINRCIPVKLVSFYHVLLRLEVMSKISLFNFLLKYEFRL